MSEQAMRVGPASGSRRRPARIVVALAAALLLGTLPAPGVMARADAAGCGSTTAGGPVVACGTTTVVGSSTAVIPLELPAATAVDLTGVGLEARPRGFEVDSEQLFAGFILVPHTPDRRGPGLLGGKFAGSSLFGRHFPYTSSVLGGAGSSQDSAELPAGRYLLFLVTDGGPASITIHFEGLEGTTVVAPVHRPPAQVQRLAARAGGSDVNANVFTSGYQQDIGGPGFLMLINSLDHTAHVAGVRGDCGYTESVDEMVAFAPGCPGRATADGVFFQGSEVTVEAPWWLRNEFFTDVGAPAGTYGLGFWQATAGVTPRGEALAVWLELEAPPQE